MHTVLPFAHAFGARYELPIPLWLFVVGGASVVVFSFLLVMRRTSAPMPTEHPEDVVPLSPFHPIAGSLCLLLTLAVAVVGITGSQVTAENIAPLFFWVFLWIVVPLTAGVIGDWSRPVNPFASAARLANNGKVRKAILAREEPLAWKLGWWPAFVAFVLLVLGELVFNLHTTVPGFVGWGLVVYLVLCVFLGLLFGDGFLKQGEVFSGLYNTWGRLGFWRHGAPGARGFAGGLDVPFTANLSRVVFVLLLLISINFDGLLSTPQWASYERRTYGINTNRIDELRTLSLLVLIAIVLVVFAGFAYWSSRSGRFGLKPLPALALLLPSLVPIAFGYLVAHYLQYVVTNGQLLFPLIGNPGYDNWPIHLPHPFNDSYEIHRTALPNSFYWYLAVFVIVTVHVIAVIIANRRLASRASTPSLARRSEYAWLVAMVAYTSFSLFLIAQPLTQESHSATTVQQSK